MNLPELCEPLFQYICCLNRIARTRQPVDEDKVRLDLKDCFARMETDASHIPELEEQYKKVKLPLVFFVDSIIYESTLPFGTKWKYLAFDYKEMTGDQKFFDMLDATLKDSSQEANERLVIFHTCIGLGFRGWYTSQPEYLRKQMRIMEPRIASFMSQDNDMAITPDAYKYTNNTNLPLPVGASIVPIIIGLAALFILVGVVNYYLFDRASTELQQSLASIEARDPARIAATDTATSQETTK
jgi:type VI protein secretion system component VasF